MAPVVIGYLIIAWITALAERSYFDAVARETGEIPSLEEVGLEMRRSPRRLFQIAMNQTAIYLRLLIRTQANSELEFRRRIALAMVIVLVASFVLVVLR